MNPADDPGSGAPLAGSETVRKEDILLHLVHPHLRDHVRHVMVDTRMIVLQLGQPVAAVLAHLPPDHPRHVSPRPTFRRRSRVWEFAFDGEEFLLPAKRGFSYLHYLLAHPGEEIEAQELILRTLNSCGLPQMQKDAAWGQGLCEAGDLGDLADSKALKAARRRLHELEEQIEIAERIGDATKAEMLIEEKSQFVRYLGETTGLRGRPRVAGSEAERARQSVRSAITSALRVIEAESESMATHLRTCVRTGFLCSYRPAEPLTWQL